MKKWIRKLLGIKSRDDILKEELNALLTKNKDKTRIEIRRDLNGNITAVLFEKVLCQGELQRVYKYLKSKINKV